MASCSGEELEAAPTSPSSARSDIHFVQAPHEIQGQCRRTAKRLGYPVPCPRLLPDNSTPTPIDDPALRELPYADEYVRPGFRGYRRWMFLTVEFPTATREGHLVISASPQPVDAHHFMSLRPSSDDKLDRVERLRFRGSSTEVVRVLVSDGSIFQRHTVLMWPEGGHTYGVGFHGLDKEAEGLNLEVASKIELVGP
jgi:hypothetical protein